ncbi:MAG: FadR family transcriptional regulator [Pirellulales bacterium]|nr:FadR family transcriptional regulator [Pirellulales bacterium]
MEVKTKHKLGRKRLSEDLTTEIRNYIIDKGLKPGDALLTEQQMVERFGVSRPVVREATKALDFLGIIRSAPRRGMILDSFDFDRVSEYFGFHFALSDYPKDELLKSRIALETGALYYTMEAMREKPELFDYLMECVEIADTEEDIEAWIEHDIAFHRALVEVSNIGPLGSFCDLIHVFFHEFHDKTAQGHFVSGKEQHEQIVHALRDGHVDEAVRILRFHLSWYEDDEEPGVSS